MSNTVTLLLATVDRVSNRLGPINNVIDSLMTRIVPQAKAQACHGSNTKCGESCLSDFRNCLFQGKFIVRYSPDPFCSQIFECWQCNC